MKQSELRKRVRLARLREGCGAILIVFDSDDDCPNARCRSFRKLVGSFGRLMTGLGTDLPNWPPRAWREIA